MSRTRLGIGAGIVMAALLGVVFPSFNRQVGNGEDKGVESSPNASREVAAPTDAAAADSSAKGPVAAVLARDERKIRLQNRVIDLSELGGFPTDFCSSQTSVRIERPALDGRPRRVCGG